MRTDRRQRQGRRHTPCAVARDALPAPLRGRQRGFTLTELLTAVVILGVIALVVLPRFGRVGSDARKQTCYTLKGNIDVQVQLWYREKAAWPAQNLSDIAADPAYFPEGVSRCPVDGTAYSLDATTHCVQGHVH